MANEIFRRPRARLDLIEIWSYIADDNEAAADRMLDRFDRALRMLSDQPLAGRERPELAAGLRSFPVGNYVLYYRPLPNGVDLIRVRSGYMDIEPEDIDASPD
jgi:toxin ParE1/3/4